MKYLVIWRVSVLDVPCTTILDNLSQVLGALDAIRDGGDELISVVRL